MVSSFSNVTRWWICCVYSRFIMLRGNKLGLHICIAEIKDRVTHTLFGYHCLRDCIEQSTLFSVQIFIGKICKHILSFCAFLSDIPIIERSLVGRRQRQILALNISSTFKMSRTYPRHISLLNRKFLGWYDFSWQYLLLINEFIDIFCFVLNFMLILISFLSYASLRQQAQS